MSFKNISFNFNSFNSSRSFNNMAGIEEHSGDGDMLVLEPINQQLQKKGSASRWIFGVVLPISVFGALFVLALVQYGWKITHLAFSHGVEGYQPHGSPPFEQTGNHRPCKDTKSGILAQGLMLVEIDDMTRDWKMYTDEYLPDIYNQSSVLHSDLVQLLEYDAIAKDSALIYFYASFQACTNLSLTTNRKAAEVKEKILALEEIIQCNRQTQPCGQLSMNSEVAATQLISNIISLHMDVVGYTADMERLILRQARKTLTACGILRSQIWDVLRVIQDTIQKLEGESNKLEGESNKLDRKINMNDNSVPAWVAWMPWKTRSIPEYGVEKKERGEPPTIYQGRTRILNDIRKSCIELRIILDGFTLQVNMQYENWHSLSNNKLEECFFPALPPLEKVLGGDKRLSGWTRQVVSWADNQNDFADATKKAVDRKMGRTG